MYITGGQTIEVLRRTGGRDRHGDGELVSLGTIDHCVFQWASAASVGLRFHNLDEFGEHSSLAAVIFVPRDAEIQVQAKDRVRMQGDLYQVMGDRAWDENHPATGFNYQFYMIQVEKVS